MLPRSLLRSLIILAVLLGANTANAARVTVQTVWNDRIDGELVEGVRDDYLIIRDDAGSTRMIKWYLVRDYSVDGTRSADLPWPSRLTVGVRGGFTNLSVARLDAYVATGLTVGGAIGWSFDRAFSAITVYEATWPGDDVRNRGAESQLSNFAGGGVRFRGNSGSGGAGVFFEALLGLRTIAYKFDPNDGGTGWDLPRGPMSERASLSGWETRVAMGAAVTITRDLSFDVYAAIGGGQMTRYSDTLNCATFAEGSCGAHHFSTTVFGIYLATHYH